MRVAVLGAGSVGLATAALLCQRGHEPIIWSPSGRSTRELARGTPLVATGALSITSAPRVAASCAEAMANASVVLIAVPGYGHRAVMDAALPHLRSTQSVIVSSHCSMSALYLSKGLASRGVAVPIVAWGTTIVAGRRKSGSEVAILTLRKQVDVATLPVAAAGHGLELCRSLFGEFFVPRDDLVSISLSNLNPQNHLGQVIGNFTRIERGEAWENWQGYTDCVGRLIEALDAERLAIAASLGYAVRNVREHFALSFHVPEGPVSAMTRVIAERDSSPGPASLETRYVVEDVPFGIVVTALLARIAGVAAPLHEAGIAIVSALYGRDFRRENDLLPELGIERMSVNELVRHARDGWKLP